MRCSEEGQTEDRGRHEDSRDTLRCSEEGGTELECWRAIAESPLPAPGVQRHGASKPSLHATQMACQISLFPSSGFNQVFLWQALATTVL